MSKATSPRRMAPLPVLPAKSLCPAPLLRWSPKVSYKVSSLLAASDAVKTDFQILPQELYIEPSAAVCRLTAKSPEINDSKVASTVLDEMLPDVSLSP